MFGLKSCLLLIGASSFLFSCLGQRPSRTLFEEERQSHIAAEKAAEKKVEAETKVEVSSLEQDAIASDVALKEQRVANLTEELEILQSDSETSIIQMQKEMEEKEAERAMLEIEVQNKMAEIAKKEAEIKDMTARVQQIQRTNDNLRTNIIYTRQDLINCQATR